MAKSPYFVIDNFARGLDRRRPPIGALPGSLYIGTDVHITDGGTIAVRKKFVPTYQLPAGRTKGFARAAGSLYVFGSDDPSVFTGALALPAGVNYVQCEHPDGFPMTEMLSYDVFDGKTYVAAKFTNGSVLHFYDGVYVPQIFDARARGFFAIYTGTVAGAVTQIKINGIDILGAAVTWATSHSATAAAIAAQINSYTSTPQYTATSAGAVVYLVAEPGTGAAVNGYVVEVIATGDLTVSTPENLLNGADNAPDPGAFVKTYGTKMYYVSGSLAAFSGVNAPTKYDENAVGAGAINMSNHVSGSEELMAIVEFLGYLAFFSRTAVQVWAMSADPALNARQQVVDNVGLLARRAAIAFGEADVYFLTARGIRALRPSDVASNFNKHVSVSDPINKILLEALRALSDEVIAASVATIDPVDGRFLLALGNYVYVLSYFPESQVAAWSIYDMGYQITDWVITEDRLYARAGNTIYLYGGEDDNTYDDTVEPVVRIENIQGNAPATVKTITGADFGIEGEWNVVAYLGVNDPTEYEIGTFTGSTYGGPSIGIDEIDTHLALEFRGRASAREIINLTIHYVPHESD